MTTSNLPLPPPLPPPPPPPLPGPPQEEHRGGWLERHKVLAVTVATVATLAAAVGVGVAVSGGDGDGDAETASVPRTEPETTREETTSPPTDEPTVTTTTVPESVSPTTVAIGQPVDVVIEEIEFGQGTTYATVTVANPVTAEVEPGEFGMEPTNGLFLVVDVNVSVTPDSEGTFAIGEMDFNFVGGDNSVYQIGFATEFGPMLGYVSLSAGQQASGKLIFDLPPDKLAGGNIELIDTYENYGEPLAFWTL